MEVMISHGQDEAKTLHAVESFSDILKKKIIEFSTEWSDLWPRLQEDTECARLVKIIGHSTAHKVFSQHLKDIKADEVGEVNPHYKTQKLDQRKRRNLDKSSYGHPAESG